jgi:Fe-S cluster assembly protein SufD
MIATQTDFKSFVQAYLENQSAAPASIAALSSAALERLKNLEVPTTRHEEWKYTSLKPVVSAAFELAQAHAAVLPVSELSAAEVACRLTFINGQYEAGKSHIPALPEGVLIAPLSEAIVQHPDLVARFLGKNAGRYQDAHQDFFVQMNLAQTQPEGLFVYLPANKTIDFPIYVHFAGAATEGARLAQLHNLYVAGTSAAFTIVEEFAGASGGHQYFTNILSEVSVAANARVEHIKLQTEGELHSQVNNTISYMERDSYYANSALSLSGQLVRNNLYIHIGGSNCNAYMNGLYVNAGRTHVDNHTAVDHAEPHSYSNELYKGLLADKARAVFNGKIFVRQDAQKTNAFQSNKNILLSPDAHVDTKPQLEIWADDVKCSHGCTVGALDEEPLFYLRSRGISYEEARAMLVLAFVEDVLDRIPVEPVRDYVSTLLATRLGMSDN